MNLPIIPITREEAAAVLKVSLSTLDNMIASKAMPAPVSIKGSRRKYWHPEIFYGWLDKELRENSSEADASAISVQTESNKPPGRKPAAVLGIADRARARDAARIARLDEEIA